MAASGQDLETEEGESYIEAYTKGLSAVDTILQLDRLRQSVAVKEKLNALKKPNKNREGHSSEINITINIPLKLRQKI